MPDQLFSGGAVGAVMGEVLRAALVAIDKGRDFGPTLERNLDTLEDLAPLVEEIERYNQVLDRPKKEVERLVSEIRAGKELVNKYSNRRWWRFLSFPGYRDKLRARDESLTRHLSVNLQTRMARDLMETLSNVRKIIEILSSKENFGQYHGIQIKGLYGAPEKPEYTVGMDEPMKKLKVELLKGGVSVLVLTGLGGSGKSTLAKRLCWDDEIKGKFKGNIFFVTVSKTPDLKTIVRTLFEYCGCDVPEFLSDEDAINRLGILLRQVGRNPIFLVLDDVWPNSEALVEKFKFQMSDYKILVTSRIAFRRFGTPCYMNPLGHDDAISLFCHFAKLNENVSGSYMPDKNLVQEIVKGCKGSPLALEVIGGSLCQQPFEVWQNMKERLQRQSILESNTDLLNRLQNSLDILEDDSCTKEECFMDLGLFPEDQRVRVASLIDMWAELHKLDEDGSNAMAIIHDLTARNLVNLIVTRKVARDPDMYYDNHFVILHDLLRELAIHQSSQEPFEQRKRLIIDLNEKDRPEWWAVQSQQGIFGRILSYLPRRLIEQKQLGIAARTLSISTDETFTSDWCDMQPDKAEVLILNLRSGQYTLPEFTTKMTKLKVLIVTNYGFHPSELNKFELLSSLSDLKRMRLEKVSVPCLCILKNLRKLSLHMCNTKQALDSSAIQISDALPNLVEMNIDYCNDLVELPAGLCKMTSLKKLSITNCHKLSALPQEIGKLKTLEVLRLSSCSDLLEMPEFVGGLHNLSCLDISDCIKLNKLPDDIGDLGSLEKLYMKGCSSLSELPSSVMNFEHSNKVIYVICDEERAALWDHLGSSIPNLRIEIYGNIDLAFPIKG